ncbi:integrase [Sporomusaceae bacterium BoRhaA]|nr:integrase [Pelorhabdus rhamnosifermentans]
MRRGELLALSWDAIDFKAKTIFVKRSLSHTKEKGYEFKLTKNNTRRKIEVTSEVLDALRIRFLVQQILQEKLGNYYEDNNLVFCREDGKPMYPGTPSAWFPDFCAEHGLPKLTFHCLRHTHASQLLSTGEDISYVSKRLGHSDVSVTYKRYFHLIPLEQRESLRALEKKFKNKKLS